MKFRRWSWAGWRKTGEKLEHLQQRLYGTDLGVIAEGKSKLLIGRPCPALVKLHLKDCQSCAMKREVKKGKENLN